MEKRYHTTTNKRYAETLSYLGFKYMRFDDKEVPEYSFLETDELNQALKDLKQLKLKYRK